MSKPDNSLEYIRRTYRVPAYRDVRVQIEGHEGVIERGQDAYLLVRFAHLKGLHCCHPTHRVVYGLPGIEVHTDPVRRVVVTRPDKATEGAE